MPDLVYLDYHATTPVDPRVVEAMLPYFTRAFGNPSSTHVAGAAAAEAVEDARAEVAALIGADARDVIFVSGATEATNLALKGIVRGDHPGLATTALEHPSVLKTAEALAEAGASLSIVATDRDGQVDLSALEAVADATQLVSLSAANHETGALASMADAARITHDGGALLHVDAAQAAGKVPLDVAALEIELLSVSAHKLYGPKGVGALVARGAARARLRPLLDGGGQEGGLRSGTLNVPAIVGFGVAARIAAEVCVEEGARLRALRERLLARLREHELDIEVNAPPERLPGSLNIRIHGVDAQALLARCPDVAFSAGSACAAGNGEPSALLRALGYSDEHAEQSVRLCVGRPTTEEEVERAACSIGEAALAIRAAERTVAGMPR